MKVYRSEMGVAPVLYVERGAGAPFDVVAERLELGAVRSYALPSAAEELSTRDEHLDEVSEALAKALGDVKTTKAVRRAIGTALGELGLDPDGVEWWTS